MYERQEKKLFFFIQFVMLPLERKPIRGRQLHNDRTVTATTGKSTDRISEHWTVDLEGFKTECSRQPFWGESLTGFYKNIQFRKRRIMISGLCLSELTRSKMRKVSRAAFLVKAENVKTRDLVSYLKLESRVNCRCNAGYIYKALHVGNCAN